MRDEAFPRESSGRGGDVAATTRVTIGPSLHVMWLGLTRTNSGYGKTTYTDTDLGTVTTGGETRA